MTRRVVFVIVALACLTPWASSPAALAAGVLLALLNLTVWEKSAKQASRLLIQWSIVLLGFSIDLQQVARAGAAGVTFAAATILVTFLLGWALGRWLGTEAKVTTLLCSGTAICGGSAIAATGSVIRATDAQMSVALAAVFALNAVALWIFPPLGHALGMSQAQFGTWAAVAIHDMSSVVGAGRAFGDEALDVATVVKLSRVLWIVPVSLLAAWFVSGRFVGGQASEPVPAPPAISLLARLARIVPWFIALFLLASLARTLLPGLTARFVDWNWAGQPIASVADLLKALAKQGMVLALFLIGCGLSKQALRAVGWRPLLLAVVLWVVIATSAAVVVKLTL